MTLDKLKPGTKGRIHAIDAPAPLRKRLLDLGLTPGTLVFMGKAAPFGGPVQLYLRGYALILRLEEARHVVITEVKL